MPRPIHFEIPVENADRVIAFYEALFGWSFHKWEGPQPYWLISTGPDTEPGINGGMMIRRDPQQPCVNTVSVVNLDESVAAATSRGGTIEVPKMAIPGVGWLAYCKDPDGNLFGMMQADPSAA